ncbi:hypothetical protein [Aquabacterium olei]|uniref:hypothetical protein n=1 Tax=Aquabacterium olei TaxID=1296669 RepID=UPI00131EF22E|nr:hypothetical protein [Aquabacterium olei]
MSHETGASARPSLDRPSLFAGMDPDHPEHTAGGQPPVGLLSTLESARQPARGAPSTRRRQPQHRARWQKRAAVVLMAGGALALLATFSMVVQEGNPEASRWAAAPHTNVASAPAAVASAAHSATPKAPGSGGPLAALTAPAPAARIENVAPDPTAGSPQTAAAASAVAAAPSNASTSGSEQTRGQPSPAPLVASTDAPADAQATKAHQPGKPPRTDIARAERSERGRHAERTASAPRANRPGADDVALVQALMTHTRPRQAAPGAGTTVAAADWATCKALTGAQGATCRARYCVQHPRDPVCHAD